MKITIRYCFYFAFFLLLHSNKANSQDMHLSQFYSAPLYLNPALTGYFPCDYRFGLNYRSQWGGFAPIKTQSVWGDGKLSKHFFRDDWFGVGGMIYGDQAGGGTFKNTKFMANAAYHKGLFKGKMFSTSIGVSLGLVNRSISAGDLVFDNQWNGTNFSASTASGENIGDNSMYFFDMNGGIALNFTKSKYKTQLGVSLNHITMPDVSFTGSGEGLGMKTTIHGSGEIKLGSISLQPKFAFTTQSSAKEIIVGANAVYNFNGIVDLYFGLWDRISGDIIPTVGLDYKGWLFLFNYDVNYSSMTALTGYQGGWELSLSKTFGCGDGSGLAGGSGRKKKSYCPAYD